MSNLI